MEERPSFLPGRSIFPLYFFAARARVYAKGNLGRTFPIVCHQSTLAYDSNQIAECRSISSSALAFCYATESTLLHRLKHPNKFYIPIKGVPSSP
jgi:hypothetical protein